MIRARKGSANTARGALRFVEELIPRVARAGASGPKLLRANSGFWNTKIMNRLESAGWTYSIGVRQQKHVDAAIAAIAETAWQPWRAGHFPAPGAGSWLVSGDESAGAVTVMADGDCDDTTDDIPTILDRPARSFEQFATNYALAFSSARISRGARVARYP